MCSLVGARGGAKGAAGYAGRRGEGRRQIHDADSESRAPFPGRLVARPRGARCRWEGGGKGRTAATATTYFGTQARSGRRVSRLSSRESHVRVHAAATAATTIYVTIKPVLDALFVRGSSGPFPIFIATYVMGERDRQLDRWN
jgi:hypothetical protein